MDSPKVLLLFAPSCSLGNSLLSVLESSTEAGIELHGQYVEFPDVPVWMRDNVETLSQIDPKIIVLVIPTGDLQKAGDLFQAIKEIVLGKPIVVATETGEPEQMFKLLESGIADFITFPFKVADILPRLWRLLAQQSQEKTLTQRLKERLGLKQLIGESQTFLAEIQKVPLIAKCDASVMISGETGTGKELCARAVHYLSARASKPLIPINCGAIPVELMENELFGHERGAFTGASRTQPGLVQEAYGGTLFLDEVDCLPPLAQVKLLRLIQEREYRLLGSTKIRRADVRVISATNATLEEAVRAGKFRQDLYYRLNVIPLKLPPLRERPEDIPLLANHFLMKHAAKLEKLRMSFSHSAMQSLMLHNWPGNVRELEYIVERAVVLSEQPLIQRVDVGNSNAQSNVQQDSFHEAKARVIANFEKTYLHDLLSASSGNITKAAQLAKKNRRAFWQLIRKHRIDVRQFKLSVS